MSLGRNVPGTEAGSNTFAGGNQKKLNIRMDLRDELTFMRQHNGHLDQLGPIGKASMSIFTMIIEFDGLGGGPELARIQ